MSKTPATPSSTTSTTTSEPWSGAAQYLLNGGTSKNGIYGDITNYASKYSKLTPQQTKLVAGQQNILNGRPAIANSLYKNSTNLGNSILSGTYNTNYGPVANAVAGQATNGHSEAGYSDLQRGMANFGGNDPRDALSRALSGDVNNDVVGSMNQANINRSMQGYNDAMLNMGQTVLPSINNDSFASGQYGGSRQGVAQGLAIQGAERNARDLGIAAMDSGNTLYGNAYNAAQDRSSSTANSLAGLASNNEQFNAGQTTQNNQYNNTLDANTSQFNAGQTTQNNQFNADLGLQNNTQGMAQNAQNLSNMTTGNSINTNAATDLFNNQDATYAKKQNLANTPQQQALDMLNLRLNSMTPGAAMAGSTSSTDPLYSNTFGQAAGLASSVGGLVKAFK